MALIFCSSLTKSTETFCPDCNARFLSDYSGREGWREGGTEGDGTT